MARRTQFKGIAGNLAKWMISRNFDANGYWAVGVLCKEAESMGVSELAIEIVDNQEGSKFGVPLSELRHELYKYIKSCKIPEWWLTRAEVKFEFNVSPYPKYHVWGLAPGQPFICTVSLTADTGRVFSNKSGLFCKPHNPVKEQRRNGF